MDEYVSRQYPVQEHMAFQRRTWIVQRIGWIVLAGVATAALLGAFGGGPLSRRSAGNSAMTVEYERFQRVTRLVNFEFRLAAAPKGERKLHLGRAFQDNFEITKILPQPLRNAAAKDGLDFTFATSDASPGPIVIWAHPRGYGSVSINAKADDGPPVNFSVFIYP
jgi:hypothetical protein